MWKKWILAFGLGFLAMFFAACGGDSPKDVAIEATEAVFRGDSQKYLSYVVITDEARRMGVNEGKVELVVREAKKKADLSGGVKKLEILSEDIDGDKALVRIRAHFKNGTSEESTTRLRKIDNKWKIE